MLNIITVELKNKPQPEPELVLDRNDAIVIDGVSFSCKARAHVVRPRLRCRKQIAKFGITRRY